MLKGQDIVVLAALLEKRVGPPATLQEIAERLGISISSVHRSVKELQEARLIDSARSPQLAQVDEFVSHALRYVFPPKVGGEVRGIPAAGSASPLRERLSESPAFPLVWAHPQGTERGVDFEPLHPSALRAAEDPELAKVLALLDALRLNDARLRELARSELRELFAALA